MKVFASVVINTDASSVWAVMRDFIGLTAWSNVVTEARISNGKASDQVGAIRELTIGDGSVFVETLVSHSDHERSLSYDIVDGPLPVSDYIATMRVHPVTDGDLSFVSWSAEFDTSDDNVEAMRDVVGSQICASGLAALKAYCESK